LYEVRLWRSDRARSAEGFGRRAAYGRSQSNHDAGGASWPATKADTTPSTLLRHVVELDAEGDRAVDQVYAFGVTSKWS
jgi:hypothetical protein